jgi:Protein of unknown function (DUF2721)
MNELTFVLPLALLPGVATLIISTTSRYLQIQQDFHLLLEKPALYHDDFIIRRARLFHRALLGFYFCVGIFALTSLLGVTLEVMKLPSAGAVLILTGIGSLSLLYGSFNLIRESFIATEFIEEKIKAMKVSEKNND